MHRHSLTPRLKVAVVAIIVLAIVAIGVGSGFSGPDIATIITAATPLVFFAAGSWKETPASIATTATTSS